MNDFPPLLPGLFYHIYNRGNNRENIFIEKSNYKYFLEKYYHHTGEVVDTYAYCLLRNHFHLLVRVKEEVIPKKRKPFRSSGQDLKGLAHDQIPEFASQQFSNFFNGYTKSVNKKYNRSGSLFLKPFRRKVVSNDQYLNRVIAYIHFNPENHKFIQDFREYPYSSYRQILADGNSWLSKEEVLNWFGGHENYQAFHREYQDFTSMKDLIIEE
jgi:putative transposase